jgi:transposase
MSKQRYPEEFKIEAVKQITERGHKVADVSASLASASTACINGSKSSRCRLTSAKRSARKPTRCAA